MRLRFAAGLAAVVAAIGVVTGCTAGSAQPAGARSPGALVTAQALPSRSLPWPGCSTATGKAALLTGTRTAMVTVPGGTPFASAVTPDGHWAFVSQGTTIAVLHIGGWLAPAFDHAITVFTPGVRRRYSPLSGETLTADGRYLLVALGSGAVVISVSRAEQDGGTGAILGKLTDPAGGTGAVEVAVSPDDRFAFVVQEEYSGRAAVFNLRRALTQGFGPADYVGSIPLAPGPVGVSVSPDGRWLYVTSEAAAGTPPAAKNPTGTLTVIDLHRAETDPAKSVIATARAGCEPVRVVTSADGQQVWVTARESDDLLCFSAAKLRTDPAHALVAVVRVGEAPVGLMPVRGGTRIVGADSNRFSANGAEADLGVVDVAAALAGKPGLIGRIPAGGFPREIALEPGGGILLVANFASGQLEAVSVPSIP